MSSLTFSFDIGYASIGWSVIEAHQGAWPQVTGAGVVLFPSGDCLASERRKNRRMRRTIRSRRVRIERMGSILESHGIITPEERHSAGAPLPFLLAAQALKRTTVLTPLELWHVLRWYAHNRGSDGNALWKSQDEEAEESKRKEAAYQCMRELGPETMAETVCACLKLKLDDSSVPPRLNNAAYKTFQMAFPRNIVEHEVRAICESCSWLPERVRALILDDVSLHREALKKAGVQLPLRYVGSVLFGQLKPRFDNRIIERCPITWAQVYKQTFENGCGTPEQRAARAKNEANKLAKVPKADCREFYEYRFARILDNIRVADKPLLAEQRATLWELARIKKKFTKKEFINAVESLTGEEPHNLRNYFQIVPESEKALIFHPMKDDDKAGGRAPYARPVLCQVVAEVLRGEDPTRPAANPEHPDGESKANDGVLYCLQDSGSEVCKLQSQRSIDEQTNNPLVRHRMLIFERLLHDMIMKYASGDASRVAHCVVEVAREVRTFAGKTPKEIEKEENLKLKGFHDAVKHLAKFAPDLVQNAKLIKKCRIAMDMDWTCPYTGVRYSAYDLSNMDLEHIIPYAARETNALSALTLTWPEVNKMKGDLTGLEFIRKFGGQAVAGRRENLSIMPEALYRKFVEALKARGNGDDDKRRRIRKRLFLVEKKPSKTEVGFSLGQLTQSSQLMRMAAQIAKKYVQRAQINMIPGRITAETRKAWKLMHILGHCDIVPEISEEMDKETIRNITHLHHAIDACVLGLIPHLIPSGTNDSVWAAMLKRRISSEQADELRNHSKLFKFSDKDGKQQLHLQDLPKQVKDSISRALQEKRVVQHIPADMSGAKLDQQYKGVAKIENGNVYLKSCDKPAKASGYAGIHSEKLKRVKAVLEVNKNFGIALIGNKAILIRHIAVYKTLAKLRKENPGQEITILKKGMLINILNDKTISQNGKWRIRSIKDNAGGLCLDLIRPELVTLKRNDTSLKWENVRLDRCRKAGLQVIKTTYVGN